MTSPAENVVQTALTASKYFQWSPIHGGKLIFEPNITAMMSTNDRYYKAEPDKKAGKVLRIINYELVLPFTFRRVGQYDVTARMHLTLPFNTDPWDGAKEGKTAVFFSANVHYFLWKA